MAKTTKQEVAAAPQTTEQLEKLLSEKNADLLGYRKGLAANELKNTAVIKATKRDIARIKTALAGKEGDK